MKLVICPGLPVDALEVSLHTSAAGVYNPLPQSSPRILPFSCFKEKTIPSDKDEKWYRVRIGYFENLMGTKEYLKYIR